MRKLYNDGRLTMKKMKTVLVAVGWAIVLTVMGIKVTTGQPKSFGFRGGSNNYKAHFVTDKFLATNTKNIVEGTGQAIVSTFAGNGNQGADDNTGSAASFYWPDGVAVDGTGNVFVGDKYNHKIRKISPEGMVTTFAGSGMPGSEDGLGTDASFDWPEGIALDKKGNVFVADSWNHKIRKITPDGMVTTFAGSGKVGYGDGLGSEASFNIPFGVAVDTLGNVYVGDLGNNKIRKISPDGLVTTFAGGGVAGAANGLGSLASFNEPGNLALDKNGNLYVADGGNNMIRKVTPTGMVTTLAGSGAVGSKDGLGNQASFNSPLGVAVDSLGFVYVADRFNNKVRMISPTGLVSTLAGNGMEGSNNGIGNVSRFNNPTTIAVDTEGNIYVTDFYNNMIRKIVI